MEKRKTIALYSPYIPEHRGGGERYLLSVAEILSAHYDVFLLVNKQMSSAQMQNYASLFCLDLSKVHIRQTHIGTSASFLKKLRETLQYDVLYYLTDGSLFFSLAKKNILHIQFPFTFPIEGFVKRLKLLCWRTKNANSRFTKEIVGRAWHTTVKYVHYPYVDTSVYVSEKKENIILSVGRFFSGEKSGLHCKRQDVLVEMFCSLSRWGGCKNWKLVLIGSIDPGEDNQKYADAVAKAAKGLPIKILHDVSFDVLRRYYARSSIFWHAAGYGIDEEKEPKKVEHFGISTLEAMASEAVPVVIGKGGQKEIIEQGVSGFLCNDANEMIDRTQELIQRNELRNTMQSAARKRAMLFNKERFTQTLMEMVEG